MGREARERAPAVRHHTYTVTEHYFSFLYVKLLIAFVSKVGSPGKFLKRLHSATGACLRITNERCTP